MKIGNIDFNKDSFENIYFDEFKETYEGKLDGVDIKEAYKELTGRSWKTKKPQKPKK